MKGTVTVGGNPAKDGLEIRVAASGDGGLIVLPLNPVSLNTTKNGTFGVEGPFFVLADDSDTPERGGRNGEELVFFVVFPPGDLAETEVVATATTTPSVVKFKSGAVTTVDLAVAPPSAVQELGVVGFPDLTQPININKPTLKWKQPLILPAAGLKDYQVAVTGDIDGTPFTIIAPTSFADTSAFLAECFDTGGNSLGTGLTCKGVISTSDKIQITPVTALPDGKHRIGVATVDQNGELGSTEAKDFTIRTLVAPTLLQPVDVLTNALPLLFDWTDVTGNTVRYRLQVAKSGDSFDTSSVIDESNLVASQFSRTTALDPGNYAWRVKASDAVGSEVTSDEVLFSFDAVRPAAPVLRDPIGGKQTRDSRPIFKWQHVTTDLIGNAELFGLREYILQIDTGDFTSPITRTVKPVGNFLTGDEIQFPIDQRLDAAIYKWQVQAVDSAGNAGDTSITGTFEILPGVDLFLDVDPALGLGPVVLRGGALFTAAVTVKPRLGQPVSVVDAFLNFNTGDVQVVSVTPATGLDLEQALTSSFDNVAGHIDFSRATLLAPVSGDEGFSLARIVFRTLQTKNVERAVEVSFSTEHPRKSEVAFAGEPVLGKVSGARVIVLKPIVDLRLALRVGEKDIFLEDFKNFDGLRREQKFEIAVWVVPNEIERDPKVELVSVGQRVTAIDALLDFDTRDLAIDGAVSSGDALFGTPTVNVDSTAGTVDVSVSSGAAVSGNKRYTIAVVPFKALRATESLSVGLSQKHPRLPRADLALEVIQPDAREFIDTAPVLRQAIGFPAELALGLKLKTFTLPFNSDVTIIARPNGNRMGAVDAFLDFTNTGSGDLTVSAPTKAPNSPLEQVLTADSSNANLPGNVTATVDYGASTFNEPPLGEFALAVVNVDLKSSESLIANILNDLGNLNAVFSAQHPRATRSAVDGRPLTDAEGLNFKPLPPGPLPNLKKTTKNVDTTPTFVWDPPIRRPAAGIDTFRISIVGTGDTPGQTTIAQQVVTDAGTFECFTATGTTDCFVGGAFNIDVVTFVQLTLGAALGDGRYQLTVRALDRLGQTGDTILPQFTIDTTKPSVAPTIGVLGGPQIGYTNKAQPDLEWDTATDNLTATGDLRYDVVVAVSDAFTNVIASTDIQALKWQVNPALGANAYYWWRVRSYDDAGSVEAGLIAAPLVGTTGLLSTELTTSPQDRGNVGNFSTPVQFLVDQVDPEQPGKPARVLKVIAGSTADNFTSKFTWTRSTDPGFISFENQANIGSGVLKYEISITGALVKLTTSVLDSACQGNVCELDLSTVLPSGVENLTPGDYTVVVTAVDRAGNTRTAQQLPYFEGPPGAVQNLRVVGADPDVTELALGGAVGTSTPTFRWERPQRLPDDGLDTYLVEITGILSATPFTDGKFSLSCFDQNGNLEGTGPICITLAQSTGDEIQITVLKVDNDGTVPDGTHTLVVRVRSLVLKTLGSPAEIFFTVDTQGPTVTNLTKTSSDEVASPAFAWDTVDPSTNVVTFQRVHIESEKLLDLAAAPAPVLVSPIDRGFISAGDTLEWNRVNDVSEVTYELEIVTGDQPFTGDLVTRALVANPQSGNVTFTVPSGLSNDLAYKWRVRALDRSGNVGDFSEVRIFTIGSDNVAPEAPAPIVPRPGATGDNLSPTFSWLRATDFSSVTYQLDIDTAVGSFLQQPFVLSSADIPDPATDDRVQLTIPAGVLTADVTYVWRVRAVDATGNNGAFSSTSSFTIGAVRNLVGKPTPVTPVTGDDDTTPTFEWTRVRGNLVPVTYTVTLSVAGGATLETFTVPESAAGNVKFILPQAKALGTGDYIWLVSAKDDQGQTGDLAIATFKVLEDVTDPATPVLRSIVTALTARPTFLWNEGKQPDDIDSNPVTYRIQVTRDGSSVVDVSGVTATSFKPRVQLAGGAHSWKVTAKDVAGNTSEASSNFTVLGTPQDLTEVPFTASTPGSGDYTPTLEWKAVSGATSYEVSLEDGTFKAADQLGTLTTSDGTVGLTLGAAVSFGPHHKFQVRAVQEGSRFEGGIASLFFSDNIVAGGPATTASPLKSTFTVPAADFLPLGNHAISVSALDRLDNVGDPAAGRVEFKVGELIISLQPPTRSIVAGTSTTLDIEVEPRGTPVDGAKIRINVLTSALQFGGIVSSPSFVTISDQASTSSTADFTATLDAPKTEKFTLATITINSTSIVSASTPNVVFEDTGDRRTLGLSGPSEVPPKLIGAAVTAFTPSVGGGPSPAVNNPPIANAGDNVTANEGDTVGLNGSGSSDEDAGQTLTFAWTQTAGPVTVTLNDATTATPSFVAPDNGTYTFALLVTDDGSPAASAADSVEAAVSNVAPTLDQPADTSGTTGTPIPVSATFSDPGSADTHVAVIVWGDGSSDTVDPATSPITASHIYEVLDTFTVTITVTDDDGGSDSKTLTLVVGVPPTAEAGSAQQSDEGDTVAFDGVASEAASGRTIALYTWDFGDGSDPVESTSPTATHVFEDDDAFTVTLTVTDDVGLTGTDTTIATVSNLAPVVTAGDAQAGDEGREINVSATFFDLGSRDTHTASIDWGDNSAPTPVDAAISPLSVAHAFPDDGDFTVTITVTDGGSGSDSLTVTVANVAPEVDAGPDVAGFVGNPISFSGTFSDAGIGDTLTIVWDFGDGASDTSGTRTPTHTYSSTGTFTATLTVTDDEGASGTDTAQVVVVGEAPLPDGIEVVDLTVTPTDPNAGDPVTVIVEIRNVSGSPITASLILFNNGDQIESFAIDELAAGATKTFSTRVVVTEPGIYAIQVGLSLATFTVRGPEFLISNLTVTPKTTAQTPPGTASGLRNRVEITAEVTNIGSAPGSIDVNLGVDGDSDIKSVRLPPGKSQSLVRIVEIVGPFGTPGFHGVEADGQQDSYRVAAAFINTPLPTSYGFNPNTTRCSIPGVGSCDFDPAGRIKFGGGSITLSIPVRATAGVKVSSFVDTESGISIIDRDVEIPVKDADSGETILRFVGKLKSVLEETQSQDEAIATFESLRLVTEERREDLSQDDPEVGSLGVSLEAELNSLPEGATLQATIKKELSDFDRTNIEIQTRQDESKIVANEAGTVSVQTTNLDTKNDVGEISISIKVSFRWILRFGFENVRIAHVDAEGNVELLPTTCDGPIENNEFVCTGTTTSGFSEFSLLALSDIPTTFAATNLVVNPEVVEPNEEVTISVDIVNEGDRLGSFSAILSVRDPESDTF